MDDPCLLYNQHELLLRQFDHETQTPIFTVIRITIGGVVVVENDVSEPANSTTVSLHGLSNWYLCRERLATILQVGRVVTSDNATETSGGVDTVLNPPPLQFFALSEYWYTTQNVLRISPHNFTAQALEQRSVVVCNSTTFRAHDEDLAQLRLLCFKTAWLDVLLFQHHQFSRTSNDTVLIPFNAYHAMEIQWTLGALLHRLTDNFHNHTDSFCSDSNAIHNLRRQSLLLVREGAGMRNTSLGTQLSYRIASRNPVQSIPRNLLLGPSCVLVQGHSLPRSVVRTSHGALLTVLCTLILACATVVVGFHD
uniref:Ectonucleoside triphosphate diphosphohydrolase 4 n=1 Tax=Lygus hesperus TaxID=30085 RepID=A0A0A9VZG1_LYGHE